MLAVSILDRAAASLGESLPRLAGAVLLLLVGLLVAWFAGRVTRRLLLAVGVDRFAERVGVHDVIARAGFERSASVLLGRAVRIALVIVAVVASVSLLGLGALSLALNQLVLFVPRLFVALLLVVLGAVISDFVGDRVDRLADQMALPGPLGPFARVTVLALFVLTALAQLGIPTGILLAVVAMVVIAAAVTFALAFGLGGREVARELSAGRYVGGAFALGQTITVGDLRGQIVALERAATILRTPEGRTVRVPNHLLIESIVTVE